MRTEFSLERPGYLLSYQSVGTGLPTLFIQGVGVHGNGWQPQVDGLAADHRCVWFDNRGIGMSTASEAPFGVADMVDDALAVMDAAGMHSAHIVGHSLGGLVAQELALRARSRVRSLALLCTFASGEDATRLSWSMFWTGLRTRVGTRRQRRHAFLELVVPKETLATADRDVMAERLAPLFGHDLADHPPVVMRQFSAMRAHSVQTRLSELAGLPTLVVSAEHDPIARPSYGRAIATALPGARYLEIAGASHGVPIDRAGEINGLLRQHILEAESGAQKTPQSAVA
jgi:pimeloyl-ACP methyl ester carboxylesterase